MDLEQAVFGEDESPEVANGSAFQPTAKRPPRVYNFRIMTREVGLFDKFETRFRVVTEASNLNFPYDARPPAGIPAGSGISVDAYFKRDGESIVIVQPAFIFQPYEQITRDGKDHFTPAGEPRWAVRFAPQAPGEWQMRLCIQDAGGVNLFPEAGQPAVRFRVGDKSKGKYTPRGFLRVSRADARYFEFQDGSPFIGVGFNDNFGNIEKAAYKMAMYERYKMNFMRVWLSGAGINASHWSSWSSHHLGADGYLPGVSLDTNNTLNGADVAYRLDDDNPCLFADFWQNGVPVTPNKTYRVTARVKVSNLEGPAGPGDHGFVIKSAGWLGKDCVISGKGATIAGPVKGSTDWITIEGDYRTQTDEYWLDNLYLARQNVTRGEVYIDEVRIWRQDDPHQINLLREPNANSHMYFDQMNSAQWDRFFELAQNHGVYLKVVTDEKNEWIRNRLDASGAITGEPGNNNFYGSAGSKVRWLQEAWWRYLIARWGYSTAIHSFEYINEGDPYNSLHYEAANSMARFFKKNDPARHMVTTSFWHSFPNAEFWSNPEYQDIDYTDIHAYISTGWGLDASFMDTARIDTRPENIYSGTGAGRIDARDEFSKEITPRGLVMQGRGEWIVRYWMKATAFSGNCPGGTSGGKQRVRWKIDGGSRSGVVPFNSQGDDSLCTSPGGEYDWKLFSSVRDAGGKILPRERRLILEDEAPHSISLSIENSSGTGGVAWIDSVELLSPEGQKMPVLGQFDVTRMDEDTAWYNGAYGSIFGAASIVGARKPIVRGEAAINTPGYENWKKDLILDTQGVWLHNNLWGQTNSGGMYDLFWYADQTIPESIYHNYLAYRNFMEDIPLNNGHYREAAVKVSDDALRVWGQRDDVNGRMHLWAQNTFHTWKRVVFGPAVQAIAGWITIPRMPKGLYRVEWWDTFETTDPVFFTQTISADGGLILHLPQPLTNDVAIKIQRVK